MQNNGNYTSVTVLVLAYVLSRTLFTLVFSCFCTYEKFPDISRSIGQVARNAGPAAPVFLYYNGS